MGWKHFYDTITIAIQPLNISLSKQKNPSEAKECAVYSYWRLFKYLRKSRAKRRWNAPKEILKAENEMKTSSKRWHHKCRLEDVRSKLSIDSQDKARVFH